MVQVEAKYLALARVMMEFEKHASQGWLESADEASRAHMKLPVLREDTTRNKYVLADISALIEIPFLGIVTVMHACTCILLILVCLRCRIDMNFSDEMALLMREARALNRLGFAIPEAALHAVLHADHLLTIQESLASMLADYNKAC